MLHNKGNNWVNVVHGCAVCVPDPHEECREKERQLTSSCVEIKSGSASRSANLLSVLCLATVHRMLACLYRFSRRSISVDLHVRFSCQSDIIHQLANVCVKHSIKLNVVM